MQTNSSPTLPDVAPPPVAAPVTPPAAPPVAAAPVTKDGPPAAVDAGTATEPKGNASEVKPAVDAAAELTLKLPDGVQPDPDMLGGFRAAMKELGADSAKAQKALDILMAAQTKSAQAQEAALKRERTAWLQQMRDDKEFGGTRYDASNALVKKAIAKLGDPGLGEFFDVTGLGDEPRIWKLLARAGGLLSEDSIGGATGTSQKPLNPEEEKLRKSYPSMFPKE